MISKANLPSQQLPDVFPASDSLSRSEPQSEFPLTRAYQFNRLAQWFLPYLVALLVITFLLQRIHPETFWQLIKQADSKWLLAGFAFYCLTNVLRPAVWGCDEKYKDKIFIIFQRLHGTKQYEGTGIGLAHCKKIIELHHGNIWLESQPGSGSKFHFTLPEND